MYIYYIIVFDFQFRGRNHTTIATKKTFAFYSNVKTKKTKKKCLDSHLHTNSAICVFVCKNPQAVKEHKKSAALT